MTTKRITLQQARQTAAADEAFQAFTARPRTWLTVLREQGRSALRVDDVTRPE